LKILHVTYSAKGGAGIAAKRLHYALQNNGIQSAFLSTNLTINFNNKIEKNTFFNYKKPSLILKIYYKIKTIFSITEKQKIVNTYNNSISQKNTYEILSLPFSKFKIHKHKLFKEADIINLHWISGIIDYPTFFKNCNKPIVWTLHDMNPLLGIFHYKNDSLKSSKQLDQLNSKVLKIYKENINYINKGVIVTPSKWLLKESLNNGLFNNFKHYHISNIIDLDAYKVFDKLNLRSKYGLNKNDFILLFVSDSINNYRKGFDILIEALKLLQNIDLTILTIGSGKVNLNQNNIKVLEFGKILNQDKLIEIFNLADVFLLPSREDNLPNVILESFACGLPVIGFNVGGIKEHVLNNFTGINAGEAKAKNLCKSIINLHSRNYKYDQKKIKKYAYDNFCTKNQVEKYYGIYKEINK
jgi:glycosyltransferase involved in cell wall biosynthesis